MEQIDLERLPLATYEDLAQLIDHSLVRPELTDADIHAGCQLAREYGVKSVSVRPSDVDTAVRALQGTSVIVGSVVGFPHGSTTAAVKNYEAREVIRKGAREIDMVLNVGKLRSRQFLYIENELGQLAETCREHGVVLKVILENSLLTTELKTVACRILTRVQADFAKTASGFAPGGCTEEDLRLMRAECGPNVRIKAAVGIRTLEAALKAYQLGADRIGATQTGTILDEWKSRLAQTADTAAAES